MKLNKNNTDKAIKLDESGKVLNRHEKRFMEAHLKKWRKANFSDIMDGIGPHPGCEEFEPAPNNDRFWA